MPARVLAEMFDISPRMVYRDMEAIIQAGIPVIAYQGAGGGIGIADGFRLELLGTEKNGIKLSKVGPEEWGSVDLRS